VIVIDPDFLRLLPVQKLPKTASWNVDVPASDDGDLCDSAIERGERGGIVAFRQRDEVVLPGPGIDVEITGDGDDGRDRGNARCHEIGECTAAAVTDENHAARGIFSNQLFERRYNASDRSFAISRRGPQGWIAAHVFGVAEIASTAEIGARHRTSREQVKCHRDLGRRVAGDAPSSVNPGLPIALEKHPQGRRGLLVAGHYDGVRELRPLNRDDAIGRIEFVIRIERSASGAAGKLQGEHHEHQGQRGAVSADTRGVTARHAKITKQRQDVIITRRGMGMFVGTTVRSWWLGFGCLVGLGLSGDGNAADPSRAKEGMVSLKDVAVVDCLLPGQVRQLGSTTYLTQRRPIRTDAADCRTRGGEYVAYDRADYKSALNVWMAQAKEGDPEAQTTVGEIFERGLGGTPDYAAAVIWYQKVVANPKLEDKVRARALFDLGTLYEQGFGVEKDQLKALNLYRRAWGAPADDLVYKSAADHKAEELRASLSQEIADRDKELQVMQKQLQSAEQQHDSSLATMQRLVAKLQAAQTASTQALKALPAAAPVSAVRSPAAAPELPPNDRGALDRSLGNFHFGRYYALIIGNQNYDQMESLKTPLYDASRAAQLLRDKYGFTVQVIQDGTGVAMLEALNALNAVLTDNDNLLIYYAGHGYRLKTATTEAGYWLPRNAERPPNDTFWVPTEQITANIGRLKAKRVLVVADSCYAGLLSDDPFFFTFSNAAQATQAPSAQLLQYRISKRARLLIASGGDNPVLDESIDGKNSVFAKTFLDILESNQNILTSPALFSMVQGRVKTEAAKSHFAQQPEMKAIKGAGHEAGDFFFVPKGLGKT